MNINFLKLYHKTKPKPEDKAFKRKKQIWPSFKICCQYQDRFSAISLDRYTSGINAGFYHPIDSLNSKAGTVCSPGFLLDKNPSVITADTRSWLSRSVSVGKLDKTMQNSAVWCKARQLIRTLPHRKKPHDALQHVTGGVIGVILQS